MKAEEGLTAQEFGVILVAHLDALCSQLAGMAPILAEAFGDSGAMFAGKEAYIMSEVLEDWLNACYEAFGRPNGQQQAEALVCFMSAMAQHAR